MSLLLVLAAWAERPFPAYDEVLITTTWEKMDALIEAACQGPGGGAVRCNPEPLAEAIQRGEAFQSQVTEDARITYLLGLAELSRGERQAARAHYLRSVALDETRIDAWHDLGELALEDGDLELAQRAFQAVADHLDRGPRAWLGPWRLAEVAAHRHQPDAFERNMLLALERGFSFRYVQGLPNWKAFLADPQVGPSVRKLLTVYATPEVLQSLQAD